MPDQSVNDNLLSQIGFLDSIIFGLGLSLTDTLSLSDVSNLNTGNLFSLSDTLSLLDSVADRFDYLTAFSDALSLTDTNDLNTSNLIILADLINLSDALRRGDGDLFIDSISLTDEVNINVILIASKFPVHLFKRGLAGVIE